LQGLIMAVILSLLSLLWRASRPSWNLLGRILDEVEDVFASLDAFPNAETIPGLVIFYFNQQTFFANATGFHNDVRQALRDAYQPVQVILADAEMISDIDVTSLAMLEELHKELSALGIDLWYARVRTDLMDYIHSYGLEETIGPEHFYLSMRAEVDVYLAQQTNT